MLGVQTFSEQTLGHYQIMRETGRGGMSMVYEAEDTRIGRRVALKVLSAPLSLAPDQRDAMITRLKREARAIARLSHPNIVTIFDIGEDNGQHFIVMEFLEGLTLRERIADGPLPLAEVASVLDGVAAGLDAVHAAGIIHRDIKPSNVMLLPNGAVKLMDFGVARQHEDTMVTQVGSIVGSPTYMAPEQTEGAASSAATDMWSLGVTLYEMLAGRPPFVGENIPRILYQVAHEKPPALAQATPAVRDVLNRALEKRPERRFQSARQLADAFRAALPMSSAAIPVAPVSASQGPAVPPSARAASSRRPLFWAIGLLLLALLAVLPKVLHRAPASSRHAPASSQQAGRPSGAPRPRPARTHPRDIVKAAPLVSPAPAPVAQAAPRRRTRGFHHAKQLPRYHAEATSEAMVQKTTVPPAHTRSARRAIRNVRTPYTVSTLPAYSARQSTRPRHAAQRLAASHPVASPQRDSGRLETARTATPAPPESAGPKLTGTWHGTLTNHRATLVIDRHAGSEFAGTMSVHTGGRDARVAVTGHISRTGRISMRETRRLPGTGADAWDLGTEAGRVGGNGRISGTGTDTRGRSGGWSFSR